MASLSLDGIDQRAAVPLDDLIRQRRDGVRQHGVGAERTHEDDGLVRRLGKGHLEQHQIALFPVQTRKGNHTFGWRDLAAQFLAIGFLASRGTLVRRRGILVEEVSRALQVFEYPQILVGALPRMCDEQSNWIVL